MSHSPINNSKIANFLADESGPTAVEYAVMLSLVAISCIGAAISLGNATAGAFGDTSTKLANATTAKSGSGTGKGSGKGKGGKTTGNGSTPSFHGGVPAFGGNANSNGKGKGKGKN